MVEEKAGVEKENSKTGFEKNEHAYIVEGVSWVSDSTAQCPSVFKGGRPCSENSKLV